jgi:hypothetical protein
VSLIGDSLLFSFAFLMWDSAFRVFIFIGLPVLQAVSGLEANVLLSGMALCFQYDVSRSGAARGGTEMATASDTHTTDRALSDIEFEELLQRTWEMMQTQKRLHPMDQSSESPSWT